MTANEGYEIIGVASEGGSISENTEGGELAAYDQVIAPAEGSGEMIVKVTIRK